MEDRHCFICGSEENVQRCARCKSAFYCSAKCQLRDWKRHKPYCRQMSEEKEDSRVEEQAEDAEAEESESLLSQKSSSVSSLRKVVNVSEKLTSLLQKRVYVLIERENGKTVQIKVDVFSSNVLTVADLKSYCQKLAEEHDVELPNGDWLVYRRLDGNGALNDFDFLSSLNFQDEEQLVMMPKQAFLVKVKLLIEDSEWNEQMVDIREISEDNTVEESLSFFRKRLKRAKVFLYKPNRFYCIKNGKKKMSKLAKYSYLVVSDQAELVSFEKKSSLLDSIPLDGFSIIYVMFFIVLVAMLIKVYF